MTTSTNIHLCTSACVYYWQGSKLKTSQVAFCCPLSGKQSSRKYYVLYISVGLSFESCQIHFFIFFDFAFEIFTQSMVPDLACFALFLAHDHESVKKIFLFCGIKIANHRFLAKNIFAMLGKDDQQKGTVLRGKHKTRLPFSPAIIPSPRGSDLSFSRWRRCYKSRGVFPLYLASEVQTRSNAPVPGQNLATKVSKSHTIPPYVPGVNPQDGCW